MEEELVYRPNANVVRSARSFIRNLCEVYGHSQGMAVWDKVREVLGERAAGDIFLGMLTADYCEVVVKTIGQYKIEAIKEVRAFTGWGLKEAKDFVESVSWNGPKPINLQPDTMTDEKVEQFRRNMARIGCVVE